MAMEKDIFSRKSLKVWAAISCAIAVFILGDTLRGIEDGHPTRWELVALPTLLALFQISWLYFDRDQHRGSDFSVPSATVIFRLTKVETAWRLFYLLGMFGVTCKIFQIQRLDFHGELFLAGLFVLAVVVGYQILRRDRYLKLSPTGLEFPFHHDGPIAWTEIDDVVAESGPYTFLKINLRSPARQPIRHFWDGYTRYGPTWSEDGKTLRFAVTGFGAGAAEIYQAIGSRLV